jgi:uncharacterized repeat protein (TIGR01451 family)
MKSRLLRFGVLAMLFSIAFMIKLTTLAFAQDKQTGAPQPTPFKGASPTPASPDKPMPPLQSGGPQFANGVDYSTSGLNVRGTHPGEDSLYTLTIANLGSTTGAATEAHIAIPANVTYVPGSAQVQGGGTLIVLGSSIDWTGMVTAGDSITITYQVILPGAAGLTVLTTATVYDPGLPALVTLGNTLTTQAPSGGPDAFGYAYQDNLAPGSGVTYSWIPPSGSATQVDLGLYPVDDVVSAALPIGFPFRFYKNTYSDLYVNSNGLILFGAGNASNTDNTPELIPYPGSTDNYASCMWNDMYMLNSSQGVWIETFGSAPNRYTVITFQAAYFNSPLASPALFQMILYETSNLIKCQYAHTHGPFYGSGGQAQIGMENEDGTAGLSYFFRLDYNHVVIGPLEDNLALEFTPGPAALPVFVTSSVDASANVHPGDVATYTLHVRNSGTAPSSITTVSDPIPADTTYVPGSAAVLGGGILDANASHVNWSGTVAAGSQVTITFQVQLSTQLDTVIINTVTIADPQAIAPYTITNQDLRVLPAPTGGPDAFGYTYDDTYSGGSVTYSWVPTTTPSSKVNFGAISVDDVVTGTIPIGFPFQFYSGVYTDFYVSSNGLVSFGAGFTDNINTPIPNPGGVVRNYASCFWDDLFIQNASQGVWVETSGSAPNRQAIITFRTQYFITSGDPKVPPSLFQMILYESSNQIKCQYSDMAGSLIGSGGSGATVGLQNADGTSGIQYFFQPQYGVPPIHGPLENNLAVLFTPGSQVPVFTASSKSVSKEMHPGETAAYTVVIRNNAAVPSSISTLSDPIPGGTSYVPGSAQVVGGGLLNATSTNVSWQGTVAPSQAVTVSFDVVLDAVSGMLTNTATIDDPFAVFPVEHSARTPIQPATGFGVGLPGYFYQDSYAPGISYSWAPTTTSSTKLAITQGDDDNGYGSLPLGFSFSFFDRSYSNVQISTNGLVMFNDAGSTLYTNQPIPTPGVVDNYATCFWADQVAKTASQGVWLETFGSAPDRFSVITFELQDTDPLATEPYLYQMILYENGGMIKCQYAHMSAFVNGDGRSATIGIEDPYGTSGVQYFYTRQQPPLIGPVEDGLAIEFKRYTRISLPVMMK